MRKSLIFISLLGLALLFSCSGTDKHDVDTTPPYPPTMIPHLGDPGDAPTTYYGQPTVLTDENNGIDTVPEGDWIRISWKPFLDEDLNLIRVWRFDELNQTPVKLDSLPPNKKEYLDSSLLTERLWYSYFIDIVDFAGNYSTSDTVSYAILPKPMLLDPPNNGTVSRTQAVARWSNSGFATSFRFMLFDSNHNYKWHQDYFTALEDQLFVTIPVTEIQSGQSYYWRVDAFDWDEERQQYLGAESMERVFHVQ